MSSFEDILLLSSNEDNPLRSSFMDRVFGPRVRRRRRLSEQRLDPGIVV
jgi:hypothetical protein